MKMFYNTEINTIYDDKLQTIPNLFNDGTSVESHDTHPMNSTDTFFKGELQNNQINQGIYGEIYNCDIISASDTFQMSYGEPRGTFAPGPSAIISDMVKQNDEEILGPLEIDVSEMAATTYGCDPKKSQRESAGSLCHRMALSDGAMYNSSGIALRPTTTSRSYSSVGVSSSTTCPIQLSRKSKGKPENICQLMTSAGQRTSVESKRTSYETKNGKALLKGRSVSVTTFGDLHATGKTIAATAMSLKKFASQLRSPRFFEPVTNLKCSVPYTPPPMLSPMRRGSGLFWKISQTPPSKISMLHSSQGDNFDEVGASESRRENETDEEPIGKRLRRCITSTLQPVKEISADEEQQGMRTPIRKNGLCYSSQFFDTRLLRLEALRKESNISWNSSNSSSIPPGATDLPSPRKLSVSLDGEAVRKISSCSDFGEEIYIAPESDAVPHINCGRDYQVKVKKWADRAITDEERDAIPDRDDAIFDCNVIDHLDDSAVEAYELLAYSKAVPRPGRNRELALHLLMENKGNIQEAVLDLMRSDTLDWSQYPIIYNSIYTDTSSWTPEEISFFQDAIYKGEKDFHQVASDLGNKTVKQCVEFYYMWKKACPDDYRKLRNLRRKRQLLEMQQQLDLMESYNLRSNSRPAENDELSDSEEGSDLSVISHDARKMKSGNSDRNISCSPVVRKYSVPRFGELPHSSASSSLIMGNDSTPRSFGQLHRTPVKKGAQPAADGFFHCRLCDKYFEKVKSLNAHMKSHAMKARAEAEAAQSQLDLQHHDSNIKTTNVTSIHEKTMSAKNSLMTDSMSFVHHHHQKEQQQNSLNTDPLKATIERPIMQVTNNFAASSTAAAVASEQHPFGGGRRLGQDLFMQTGLTPEHHHFTQNTLMSGSLGLAAHQALNQSLTAASVLNQFPQTQALQFLNNLQNPAITH